MGRRDAASRRSFGPRRRLAPPQGKVHDCGRSLAGQQAAVDHAVHLHPPDRRRHERDPAPDGDEAQRQAYSGPVLREAWDKSGAMACCQARIRDARASAASEQHKGLLGDHTQGKRVGVRPPPARSVELGRRRPSASRAGRERPILVSSPPARRNAKSICSPLSCAMAWLLRLFQRQEHERERLAERTDRIEHQRLQGAVCAIPMLRRARVIP